jgi:hypothetical protein
MECVGCFLTFYQILRHVTSCYDKQHGKNVFDVKTNATEELENIFNKTVAWYLKVHTKLRKPMKNLESE